MNFSSLLFAPITSKLILKRFSYVQEEQKDCTWAESKELLLWTLCRNPDKERHLACLMQWLFRYDAAVPFVTLSFMLLTTLILLPCSLMQPILEEFSKPWWVEPRLSQPFIRNPRETQWVPVTPVVKPWLWR